MQLDIIQETSDWIAINKPAGLLSIPDREGKEPSLKSILQDRFGEIFVIHRLDKETSGLILFAKNAETHKSLSLRFEERTITKLYQGIVTGTLTEKTGVIDLPIGEHPSRKGMMAILRKGKPSVTEYKVQEEFGKYSLVEFNIHTGRTHQIRIHMKNAGHPIACDELYGDGKPVFISDLKKKNYKLAKDDLEERPILNRLALHAWKLSFGDIHLEAPLPKDMRALLQQLRKWR